MVAIKFFSVAAIFAVSAFGAAIEKRSTVCGSTSYSDTDINNALNEGYNLYQEGETLGSDKYPHKYNNYEGFDFPVDGPWYEFPLKKGSTYSGGSPGADRVIFNDYGEIAGEITHTGASGDDFVGCSGTSTD